MVVQITHTHILYIYIYNIVLSCFTIIFVFDTSNTNLSKKEQNTSENAKKNSELSSEKKCEGRKLPSIIPSFS